ncbi:hypothetical protein HHX47_DHR1002055 [Lentinula edodes]|nr:hypothetical protein HHX47_DHR1002055 [Lentinula edodes]
MHFGWIIDSPKFFEYVKENFPSVSQCEGTSPIFCVISDLGLSDVDNSRQVSVQYLCDGRFEPTQDPKFVLALSIGTNHGNNMPADVAAKLNEIFAPGATPRWFLDQDDWQWKRSARRPIKLSKASNTKLITLPAPRRYIAPPGIQSKEKYLFLPLNTTYTKQDGNRIFTSQPLDILPRYLLPQRNQRFRPPYLHLGWFIDVHVLFKYAQEHHPDVVSFNENSEPDYIDTFFDLSFDGRNVDNSFNTFFSYLLPTLGFPGHPPRNLRFKRFYNGNCLGQGPQFGLSVGTNYTGTVPTKLLEKLNDFFARGVAPRWFLDTQNYRWWDIQLNQHAYNFQISTKMTDVPIENSVP